MMNRLFGADTENKLALRRNQDILKILAAKMGKKLVSKLLVQIQKELDEHSGSGDDSNSENEDENPEEEKKTDGTKH